MARSNAPKYLGLLKTDKDGQNTWETHVWLLDNGVKRYERRKAVVVGKEARSGKTLTQQRLVDMDGKPV